MSIALNLRVASLTEKGGRSRNEDALGISSNGVLHCFVVCDGAGGHGGGDIAAQTGIRSSLDAFKKISTLSLDSPLELIGVANTQVIARQAESSELGDMHATMVLLMIDLAVGKAVWGHIGDSRLYHFKSNRLFSRTKDHSVFQAMLEAGLIKSGSSRVTPSLNALTMSLGQANDFSPSIIDIECDLFADDAFLLCSDGFWDYVNEGEMERALQKADTPDQWLANMHSVLLKNKIAENDNYSAIAVWLSI
jgi:PPM family protein phosphatase